VAEQFAEKSSFRCPAPKGVPDFEELTASLKDALMRNVSFSANCEGAFKIAQLQQR
jgi:hypothetical protein